MTPFPKPADLLPRLKRFEPFQDIEEGALQWLIEKCEYVESEAGSTLFQPGDPIHHMQIILEGRAVLQMPQAGNLREIGVLEAGQITGVLPFSRMKEVKAYGKVIKHLRVLILHKDHFTEMVSVSYSMVQNLVAIMSTRIRDFTTTRVQNEKLMSLGKLSAGLAHELNNPAAAMERSAQELYNKIHKTPEQFKAVITMRVTPGQTDAVNEILFARIRAWSPDRRSLLEREEKLDELVDWLEEKGVEEAEDLAETFADFDMEVEDLERVYGIIEGKHLVTILRWIESTLSLERLIQEIREAAGRISKLVRSVKAYSHMDRSASLEQLDVHEGLVNTLTMLKHRIKEKNISVDKQFAADLPPFFGMPGELNQIWTNLIDNAVDAMDRGGRLTISTYMDRHFLCVDILDDGPGIPEEVINQIFDPFFTTKPIGKGTGMGLDIVRRLVERHEGRIEVESDPGRTLFQVCLPNSEISSRD